MTGKTIKTFQRMNMKPGYYKKIVDRLQPIRDELLNAAEAKGDTHTPPRERRTTQGRQANGQDSMGNYEKRSTNANDRKREEVTTPRAPHFRGAFPRSRKGKHMTRFPAFCNHSNDERAFITRDSIRYEVRVPASTEDRTSKAPRNEWRETQHVSSKLKRTAEAMQKGIANPKTVRFAVWVNGTWSKIALTDGQELEHTEGGPTDEGYSYENTRWIREGDTLRREYTSTARDCDGPLEHRQNCTCPIDEADTEYHEDIETGEIIMRPNWTKTSSSQRDAYAEAAGY